MEMIYGAACLDRVDPLDADRSELWPKLKLKTPPSHPLLSWGCLGCSQPHCYFLQNQRSVLPQRKSLNFTVKTLIREGEPGRLLSPTPLCGGGC